MSSGLFVSLALTITLVTTTLILPLLGVLTDQRRRRRELLKPTEASHTEANSRTSLSSHPPVIFQDKNSPLSARQIDATPVTLPGSRAVRSQVLPATSLSPRTFEPSASSRERPSVSVSEDDSYEEFVHEMWNDNRRIAAGVTLFRTSATGEIVQSRLDSLVPRSDGHCYVNSIERGKRKTFLCDRHKWWRDGLRVDATAFRDSYCWRQS